MITHFVIRPKSIQQKHIYNESTNIIFASFFRCLTIILLRVKMVLQAGQAQKRNASPPPLIVLHRVNVYQLLRPWNMLPVNVMDWSSLRREYMYIAEAKNQGKGYERTERQKSYWAAALATTTARVRHSKPRSLINDSFSGVRLQIRISTVFKKKIMSLVIFEGKCVFLSFMINAAQFSPSSRVIRQLELYLIHQKILARR